MALNIAALKERVASLKFQLDGDEVNLKWYPHRLTPEKRAQLEAVAAGDSGDESKRDGDAQMLSELLIEWDVMAGEDAFPPTYDNLVTAPQTLITRTALELLNAVGELSTPKKLKR